MSYATRTGAKLISAVLSHPGALLAAADFTGGIGRIIAKRRPLRQ
jgi:hypothetical protein